MNDIMGSLRYGNPHQTQQQYEKEQQEKVMQDNRYRNQPIPPAPTAPSPIKTAMELLESRVSHLQVVTGRLFISLQPVTRNTDDSYPAEPCAAVEGNSTLNIDINAMADRLGVITAALQLQIDRLEV